MFNSHPAGGETPSFKGSMMLAVGESEAEVRELLGKDIYAVSGVWDLENAQIIPVCCNRCRDVFGFECWLMGFNLTTVQVCCETGFVRCIYGYIMPGCEDVYPFPFLGSWKASDTIRKVIQCLISPDMAIVILQ
jgi:hypothetical protein